MGNKTSTKSKKTPAKQQPDENCIHHWVIDIPNGPASKGICKKCGVAKEFLNSPPSTSKTNMSISP